MTHERSCTTNWELGVLVLHSSGACLHVGHCGAHWVLVYCHFLAFIKERYTHALKDQALGCIFFWRLHRSIEALIGFLVVLLSLRASIVLPTTYLRDS